MLSAETGYNNIKRKLPGIIHELKYSTITEDNMNTGHRPFVAIFKKDVAMLSQ